MDGIDELLGEFITDTTEALEQVDVRIVELETEPEPAAMLNELFRLMHTIKGTCGFLGLNRMAGVAHAAESLMDRLRNGEAVSHEAIDAMLRVVDRLKSILGGIEANGGKEAEGSDAAIIAALNEAGTDGGKARPRAEAPAAAAEPEEGEKVKGDHPDKEAEAGGGSSIRVSLETLEHLMTVVSELVLTRNELTEVMRGEERTMHKLALARLSSVTGELQQAVMSTRMQPIGNAWRKLPRIVRDVSSSLGKQIDLEMNGANTELDRQVLESIKDPLMHMVRNAADHGLEGPAERIAAGKPEKGRICLSAYHEGGQILVEISDDGRGLDVDRIKAKAIERGITTPEDAERMTNEQVYSFIFEPGFSTAKEVTSVSGRGVGMDVVQSNVEKIGGSIDVRSGRGKGSIFTLKIPLTLAILRALIVSVDNEDFAIPQTSVDELLKVEPGGAHSIQLLKDAPVLRSRDRLLPVVDLRAVLNLPAALDANGDARVADESTEGFVMVMRARGLKFGMLVDQVMRTEEIVVKPLPAALRGLEIFSGSTILGDGRVIMIIDPNGVRSAAANPSEAAMSAGSNEDGAATGDADRQLLLMFRAGTHNRKALPISLITRLEDVSLADADHSDGQWHIQYNRELIPLVWFGAAPDPGSQERKPVLVMSDAGRSMGLIVDQILDIIEDRVEIQIPSEQPGVLGSAIIGGATAEVIDVSHFLGLASRHWFDPLAKVVQGNNDQILLVDDSLFFRNLVAPVVRSAGFDPVVCSSGAEALSKLDAGLQPAVIVTDVEMPEMDGFAFAKAVRRYERLRDVPILALTGMITDDAIARARAAGFDDYISKLDRPGLVLSLREFTRPRSEEIAA